MDDGEIREEVPMDAMNHQQAEREAELMQANREELVERIARAMREDGIAQPLPGLYLYRRSSPLQLLHGVSEPSVAVIAQGSKEVLLGENRYRYGPSQYLLATVELPTIRRVLEASKERPYLSLRLELAPSLVGSVLLEAGHPSHSSLPSRADVRGIDRLARELGMSVSGLRQHFKAVTAMSPSQFQKQLRLQEARRLMLSENLDAARAASRVGYSDASHFTREYKSLFGVPPMHDVQRLREEAQPQASR